MQYLWSSLACHCIPLHPLLYAAGAAVTAAGVYYYVKQHGDGARAPEHADNDLTQESVQTGCADSALVASDLLCDVDGVSVPQTDSAGPAEDSPSESEERNWEDVVPSVPVDCKSSSLKDRVRKLRKLISVARTKCQIKTNEYAQELQAHSVMKSQYKQMVVVSTRNMDSIKNLQVSLAEAEHKYKQVMTSNAELEEENASLKSDVIILQDWVQEKEEQLNKMQKKYVEVLEDYVVMKSEIKEVADALVQGKKSQRITQIDMAKIKTACKRLMKSSAKLQADNASLMSDIDLLQVWVHKFKEKMQRRCVKITKRCHPAHGSE